MPLTRGLVFLGSPQFAVPSLEILLDRGYPVLGVVTAPDRPAGRGLRLQPTEVKKLALSKGLKVMQPPNLKDPVFLEDLRALGADLQVVVAFRMLPRVVWDMPSLGTVNLHASLLPDYRGAAPIQWAIINGETRTGLTTFRLRQEIDTGPVLFQEKIEIGEKENSGELHHRMSLSGARLMLRTVGALASGQFEETPQELLSGGGVLHPAPKLSREDAEIRWIKPVREILNQVRGLSPRPGAWTSFVTGDLKILEAEAGNGNGQSGPGKWRVSSPESLEFAAEDGWVSIKQLQPEGKKSMKVAEFLRGFRQTEGGPEKEKIEP